MSKVTLIKKFEAVRALDGLQDDVKNYKVSFILSNGSSISISRVIIEEFGVAIPFDQNSEQETIDNILAGAVGIVIANSENLSNPPEVIIDNGQPLGYSFKYKAYKSGNAGEHHKVLKATVTLSDNDELLHIISSKRRNTNPGTEGDVLHPPHP
jgi:hypothetical protein